DAAELDGTLRYVASTYEASRDRLTPGVGVRGPRILNFAPLLVLGEWPVNDAVRQVLTACERAVGAPVEIEFAITLDDRAGQARVGFLQVRPMVRSADEVDVTPEDLIGPDVVIASRQVMGNGVVAGLRDIVYVRPDRFEARHTPQIASEVADLNAALVRGGAQYVLVGFGRWGSSDPWLGIQVTWPQISGARVIVESALPTLAVELSQGSHFFHNISSLGVSYFSVREGDRLDWAWLERQPAAHELPFIRHVRTEAPLRVRVDGRCGAGVILRGD
ncbi:MAG TPA: hypothetical protein VLD67_06035, partial [Vicinamibacterales bacterium]|nr:hypothetical protein [Vicinamibacterales bacterium]